MLTGKCIQIPVHAVSTIWKSFAINFVSIRYRDNVEQVISRALSSGVSKMIITSSTLEDAQQALILAETLPGVLYCTVGVHPHQAKVCVCVPACARACVCAFTHLWCLLIHLCDM